MKIIPIPTWGCDTCPYRQDFEPSLEKHLAFFSPQKDGRFEGMNVGDCPNCHVPLVQITDEERMIKTETLEASDEPIIRAALESQTLKVSTGFKEVRLETEAEMAERGAIEPVMRSFEIYRDETPEEKSARVDKEMSNLIFT